MQIDGMCTGSHLTRMISKKSVLDKNEEVVFNGIKSRAETNSHLWERRLCRWRRSWGWRKLQGAGVEVLMAQVAAVI